MRSPHNHHVYNTSKQYSVPLEWWSASLCSFVFIYKQHIIIIESVHRLWTIQTTHKLYLSPADVKTHYLSLCLLRDRIILSNLIISVCRSLPNHSRQWSNNTVYSWNSRASRSIAVFPEEPKRHCSHKPIVSCSLANTSIMSLRSWKPWSCPRVVVLKKINARPWVCAAGMAAAGKSDTKSVNSLVSTTEPTHTARQGFTIRLRHLLSLAAQKQHLYTSFMLAEAELSLRPTVFSIRHVKYLMFGHKAWFGPRGTERRLLAI